MLDLDNSKPYMKTRFKGIKTAAEHRRGELVRDILKLVGAGLAVSAAAVVAPNTLQLLELKMMI